MESNSQPSEYAEVTPPEATVALPPSAPANLPMLPPATEPDAQWQQIGRQVSNFLEELPAYIGRFFNQNSQLLISLGLIFAAILAVKIFFAVLDAVNDIPLVSPTFELIGIGYVIWFVFRYLLKASTRQELGAEITFFRKQIAGTQVSDHLN